MPLCWDKLIVIRKWRKWAIVLQTGLAWLQGEEVMEMQPLVVEGWHFDRISLELPMGIRRLERDEVTGSGARSVPEMLEGLAGIRFMDVTGNGVTGQVAMRGFGDNSGLRVLILVDGQVYNPPDMGGINWEGIELEELETVEILRGGQTVLYGNHAVSGVIKLTTREPGATPESRLGAGTGSDDLYSVRAGTSVRLGKTGLSMGGGLTEFGGYREHSRLESGTGYLAWSLGEQDKAVWKGRLTYNRSEMELPGPLLYQEMLADPRQANEGVDDSLTSEGKQLTQRGEGATGWGGWEAAIGILERNGQWNLSGRTADNDLLRATLNPRARIDWGEGFLMAGVDSSWDEVDYTGYWNEQRETVTSRARIERLSAGGYLFASRDIDGRLNLSGGIRVEAADTDNDHVQYKESQLFPELETNRGTIPNPQYKDPPDPDPSASFSGPVNKSGWAGEVSLLYRISDELSVWAGWDRVYRYPSLDETASYQGYPLSDPLNEDLEPETGDNFEVGLKKGGRNWHVGITAFRLLLNDEISFVESDDGTGTGKVRLNRNIGDSERKGVEMDVSYQADRCGVTFSAGLTGVRLENGADRLRLPLVPGEEASLTFWARPAQSLRIQLQGRYRGSMVQGNDFDGSDRLVPSYFIANASLYWDICDKCSVLLGVKNLFDRVYAVSAYSGGFYPGPGRQCQLTFNLQF